MLQILLTRNWASGESARYTDKTNHVIDRIISVALRSLMMPGRGHEYVCVNDFITRFGETAVLAMIHGEYDDLNLYKEINISRL